MKKACQEFDSKVVSKFVDNELSTNEHSFFSKHLSECSRCSDLVIQYSQISETYKLNTIEQVEKIDTSMLNQNVLNVIKRKDESFLKKVFDYFSPKFYLKIASMVVILAVSMVYFQTAQVNKINSTIGSSAIVNTVDGDISSVMIFETEKTKHTIIWFSEA